MSTSLRLPVRRSPKGEDGRLREARPRFVLPAKLLGNHGYSAPSCELLGEWPGFRLPATQSAAPHRPRSFVGQFSTLILAPLFGFRLQEGGKLGLTMLLCMGLFSIFY